MVKEELAKSLRDIAAKAEQATSLDDVKSLLAAMAAQIATDIEDDVALI